jgi:16S rRNA (cytosine967-C5)-methyltransferase
LKPEALAARQTEQRSVLSRAALLVKPGGRLVYVTCSILPEENVEQVAAFLKTHEAFHAVPTADAWAAAGLAGEAPPSADNRSDSLLLTPDRHGTDGFFIAVLARAA